MAQEIDLFLSSCCGGDKAYQANRAQRQSCDLGKMKAQEADNIPKFKGESSTQPKNLSDE